jgi:uncharacterized Zn finger protein
MAASMALTEAMIHQIADPEVFARGRDYLRQGAVSGLTRRGDRVTAEVEGSDIEPYRVSVKLSANGIGDTSCTCPYDWRGACKHIVAVLLACLERPSPMPEAVPLETQLVGLEAGQLRALLLGLAKDDPDLAARIDRRVLALRALPTPVAPPPPPDAAAIRREVRSVLRESGRRGYYDDYGGAGEVVAEVQQFLTPAEAWIEAGHGRHAIAILEGQTELHLTMLVRLRRVREAVDVGRASLAAPGQALVLAKELHEHGDQEEALSIAEFGLNLPPLRGVRGGQAAAPEGVEVELEEDEEDYDVDQAAGREDAWRAHLSGIMSEHGRKYKLMALLKPLG